MWKWLAVVVLANAAQLGVNSIYTVYVTYRYSWQPADLSVYLSYFGFLSIFLQAAVVPFMSRQFQEWTLLIVGAVLNSAFIALAGLAPFGLAYAACTSSWLLGMVLFSASTNSFLSRSIGDSDQGRVQGAARSVSSLVGLVAPGLFSLLLAYSIRFGGKPFSGVPFLVSGVLSVLTALLVVHVVRRQQKA
jgi:DHA1 family tetracycline resistance protein-like MFS transporter